MPTFVPSDIQIKNNPTLKAVDASRVGGAFQVVSNVAALASIDATVKVAGMKVRTLTPAQDWILQPDLATWLPSTVSFDNGQAARALRKGDLNAPRRFALNYTDTGFEIHDMAWRRSYDAVSTTLHDELIWVATDNLTQHFLRARVNGTVTTLRTLSEPGKILVVGNNVYIIGPNGITDGINTYTPPAGKTFSGFAARVNTLVGDEMPYDTIVVPSTNSTDLYSFNVGDPDGELAPLLSTPYNSSAVCAAGPFDFWVAASGSRLLNISYGSMEDSTPAAIRTTIVLPETITSNLVFDGKYVWGCSVNFLYRITQEGFVTKTAYPSVGTPRLSFDGLRVWVTAPLTNQLVAVDPETFRFVYNNFDPAINFQSVTCVPDVDGRVFAAASNGNIYLTYPNTASYLQFIGEEQGNILYHDGDGWRLLEPGAAGQFLQTGGTGADPSWETVTANTIIGGFHIVADVAARNAIPTDLRESGMLAWVQDEKVLYQLKDGPWNGTNSDWELQFRFPSEQHGSILYRAAAGWVQLSPGTDGQFLQTHGNGAAPTWETVTANTIIGGFHIAPDVAGRNAIPDELRESGMLVWVQDVGTMYQLKDGPWNGTNSDWELQFRFAGESHGSILYRGASGWVQLSPGTAGQLLQSNGSNAAPAWATVTANTLVGGLHIVADLTERNDIPNDLRREGMLVWVQQAGAGVMYRLKASPWLGTDADWEPATTEIQRFPLVVSSDSTDLDATSKQAIGAAYFEPVARVPQSDPRTRTVLLNVILETTSNSIPAHFDLYDLNTPGVVAGSAVSTTSLTPTLLTVDLTAALGSVYTSRILEARIWIDVKAAPNYATCKAAYLDLIFT